MKVYIMLPGEAERRAAEVAAVTAKGLDLKTEDGAAITDWRAPVYDESGGEIAPEKIRREFVAGDIAALKARIEALEALVTEN